MNTFAMPQPADAEYQFKGKIVSIPVKYIITAAYLYMVVPIAIFFVTWLRWYIGISLAVILIIGGWHLLKEICQDCTNNLVLPRVPLFFTALLVLLWIYSTTYFFYQTWDQNGRNALLRDMCTYTWPIVYSETGNALAFYLTQWIVPAIAGKMLGFIVANIVLWIENAVGVLLVFLCICIYMRPQKNSHVWLIFLILVFWGGLNDIGFIWIDILGQGGYVLCNGFGWPDMYYSYGYQYTPNDALLAWVYHQTIVPWLATTLFLINPKIKNYAYLGLCVLPFGPFPFIGLFAFLMVDFFCNIRERGILEVLKEAFSIQNICAIISIFPTFLLLFRTTSATKKIGFYNVPDAFGPKHLIFLLVFYVLEFGIYCLIIHKDYYRSPLFITTVASLIIIPHIQVGNERDFCMRTSITALFILMILVIRYLIQHDRESKASIATILLTICLTISGLGTVKDWAVKIKSVRANNWNPVIADDVGTFSDKSTEELFYLQYYLVPNYEDTAFFKYLARKNE